MSEGELAGQQGEMRTSEFFVALTLTLVGAVFMVAVWACAPEESAVTASPTPSSTPTPLPTETPVPTPEYAAIPGAYLGIYYGPSAPSVQFFERVGKGVAIRIYYPSWGDGFNAGLYEANAMMGQVTMATWEYNVQAMGDLAGYEGRLLEAIVDGVHDDVLYAWAEGMRDFGRPILLRWGHEMNGDWYPWGGANNGGGTTDGFGDPTVPDGPERYVAAYRHIHDIFDEVGADNVLWVWCPNVPFEGLGEWNAIANYYPGDQYVDWLGIDGYNWGTSAFGAQFDSRWQSFDEIFAQGYAELQAINASKPIIIGEFASTEEGGDKAAWILDTYERIQYDYPQIRAVVWFHTNKETNWRIDSSPESMAAFQEAVAGEYWLDTWPGMNE